MSQKKHKQLRKEKKLLDSPNFTKKKKKKLIFLFIAFLFMLFFLVGWVSSRYFESHALQDNDFQIELARRTYHYNYSNVSLAEAKQVFISVINGLPDQQVRNSMVDLIRSGEWQILYVHEGLFAIRFDKFFVNPSRLIANRDKPGYLGSYLLHEHYHYQDWLGNNPGSERYHDCELEHYSSEACQFEWWDAEWRAVRAQAIFLQDYNYVNEMTTGPNVNNQAIFANNDPDHAALEYLRINYYIGRMADSQELIQVFPEFYNNKLQEINN